MLLELPTEIIVLIFSYLSDVESLIALIKVCSYLRLIVYDSTQTITSSCKEINGRWIMNFKNLKFIDPLVGVNKHKYVTYLAENLHLNKVKFNFNCKTRLDLINQTYLFFISYIKKYETLKSCEFSFNTPSCKINDIVSIVIEDKTIICNFKSFHCSVSTKNETNHSYKLRSAFRLLLDDFNTYVGLERFVCDSDYFTSMFLKMNFSSPLKIKDINFKFCSEKKSLIPVLRIVEKCTISVWAGIRYLQELDGKEPLNENMKEIVIGNIRDPYYLRVLIHLFPNLKTVFLPLQYDNQIKRDFERILEEEENKIQTVLVEPNSCY